MTPAVPHGYVMIPQAAFALFVTIVALACVIELALIVHDWLSTQNWMDS